MNKIILASAIASIFAAGSVSAATVFQDADTKLDIYGEAAAMYFDADIGASGGSSDANETYGTIGLNGTSGNFFGKFELDVYAGKHTGIIPDENGDASGASRSDHNYNIDKLYVGYNFGKFGQLSYGTNDTSLDDIDAIGSVAVELTENADESDDADGTLKYVVRVGNIGASVSYNTEFTATNGYVQYFGKNFTLAAGAEEGDGRSIWTAGGQTTIGKIKLGAHYFDQSGDELQDEIGYVASVGYQIMPKWYVAGAYNATVVSETDDSQQKADGKDQAWANVGFIYTATKHVDILVDYRYGLNGGTVDQLWTKALFKF